jgi:hypothetical protein
VWNLISETEERTQAGVFRKQEGTFSFEAEVRWRMEKIGK